MGEQFRGTGLAADLSELGDTVSTDGGGDADFGADAAPVGLGAAEVDSKPVMGLAELGQVLAVVVAVEEIAFERVVGDEQIEVTVVIIIAPGPASGVLAGVRPARWGDLEELIGCVDGHG